MSYVQNSLFTVQTLFLCIALYSHSYAALPSGVKILRNDNSQLILCYTPEVRSWKMEQNEQGGQSLLPVIDGTYYLNPHAGQPAQLGIRLPITVPSKQGFHIEKLIVQNVSLKYGQMLKVKDVLIQADEERRSDPHINNKVEEERVGSEAVALPAWAMVNYSGIARDQHIAIVELVAARYNAAVAAIEIPKQILLTIRFDKPQSSTVVVATANEENFVPTINSQQGNTWRIDSGTPAASTTLKKGNSLQSNTDISSGTWLKIRITDEGVYRIDAQELQQAGAQISKDELGTLKLFGTGGEELPEAPSASLNENVQEQAIEVLRKNDGSLDAIIFYASGSKGFRFNRQLNLTEHFQNRYSNDNYYLLTWGGRQGLRQQAIVPPTGNVEHKPDFYTARLFHEDELENPYGAGSGRCWFGRLIDNTGSSSYTTTLANLYPKGEIRYRVAVAHKVAEDASVVVQEHDIPLDTLQLDAIQPSVYVEYTANQSIRTLDAQRIGSNNESKLQFRYTTVSNNPNVTGFLDYFEIHYPAQLRAINNSVEFSTELGQKGISEYDFAGFHGELRGYDVTNRAQPRLITNLSAIAENFLFRTQNNGSAPQRFFISGEYRHPYIERISYAALGDESIGADMIVITPSDFRAEAEKYKVYRESQGELKVLVADINDIFTEFACGVRDVAALRNYFAQAMKHWQRKPRYALLWGDGHFDLKGITSLQPNYLPSWQSDDINRQFDASSSWLYTGSYVSDDFFTWLIGDDTLADISIGRLPVNSKETSSWMLEKIRLYETQSSDDYWRSMLTFVADDGPASTNETNQDAFTHDSETLADSIGLSPLDMQKKKIYMVEYPVENIPRGRRKPRATEDLISTVNNRSSVILNWMGHGNPRVWAHESLLDRELTIPQFTNLQRLFFLTAATCDFARFDMPESISGAEALVLSKNGGAIGSFSASRVVFLHENTSMALDLYHSIFDRGSDGKYRRIGDMILATKLLHHSVNDQKYFLLGDPAMRLHLPNDVVQFDSINHKALNSSDTIQIKALSTVSISGHISNSSSDRVIDDFNGTATISMFDSDVQLHVIDPAAVSLLNDRTVHQILRLGGALHRGNYSVEQGRFQAEFVVPKDISFTNKTGRLYGYAQSSDHRYAKGITRGFRVGGINTQPIDDSDGPDMKIYMDARTFLSNDIVRSNPFLITDLFDQTGVNGTGIGVGHNIEAWFDDNIQPINLGDDFITSLEDSRSGTAMKQVFGLASGQHRVRVRAWDILNNYSEASTVFRVAETDSKVVSGRVQVQPNPSSGTVTIFFTHNQGVDFGAELLIYNVQGKRIRSLSTTVRTEQSGFFVWDGIDDEGRSVPQGVFPFVLRFTAPDSSLQTVTGTIVRLSD